MCQILPTVLRHNNCNPRGSTDRLGPEFREKRFTLITGRAAIIATILGLVRFRISGRRGFEGN
ncbi:hypothetical protein LguiA_000771 [Lonicera macranthoides]